MADAGFVEDIDWPPPFKAPDGIRTTVELPFPPSVNRIWKVQRRGMRNIGVGRSPEYVAWIKQADMTAILYGAVRGRRKISGPFSVDIMLNMERGIGDGDNRIKAVLDWLQSREFVLNDKFCMDGRWRWVPGSQAPEGCRVVLQELG